MKETKFDLRGWEQTEFPACLFSNSMSQVLGLIWNKNSDTLEIDYEALKYNETIKITKRKMLSIISSVFYPIVFLAPALIQPKILLQATWKTKEPWDAEVNDEVKKKFLKWFKKLNYLKNIKIPRWLGVTEMCHISLHAFVDASQTAYSACVFLRSETYNGEVNAQLFQAKSQITLLKKIIISRLELMASTIGARLFYSVKRALKIDDFESYLWTDSSTVRTWIKRQNPWSRFVKNRVTEIRKLTTTENWLHIPGDKNPAYLLSRGCGSKQLLNSKWWLGPTYMKGSIEKWPK
ncbi:hypothetical protein AVEN_208516-1 [Araneus ventricosus]|uniref:Reverse transcriptase domain-containing protein n=1 Tax=Araneus ventricosus TaxID=182803 RepID=A0A4Y2E6C3_ARAVE|nr:hypothetical protein AVEN_208516-1 [Araneus ventricosus]